MTNLSPIDPNKRIDILDILRGFAITGIIFNNILYFSGYNFIPFNELSQFPSFRLDEKIYYFLDVIITAKFYTLFSILFAVGFYLQFNKRRKDSANFIPTYRRRLLILFIVGLVHSLIWFGDILLLYAIIGFILILFRNVKKKYLLWWSILFLLLPTLIDLALLSFFPVPDTNGTVSQSSGVHTSYPDMDPEAIIKIFQTGTLTELFFLNIHHLVWKWLSYIPSGRFLITLGIFLLGYYLGSIRFFTEKYRVVLLAVLSFLIGIVTTVSAQIVGGNPYLFPPTLHNISFKALLTVGQIFLCLFYVVLVVQMVKTSIGGKILEYLKPVGKMALTNYLFQTTLLIVIFYNFGLNLIGRISLMPSLVIAILVLVFQIVVSNIWLRHYRFGPLEWIWRCLTYRKKNPNPIWK